MSAGSERPGVVGGSTCADALVEGCPSATDQRQQRKPMLELLVERLCVASLELHGDAPKNTPPPRVWQLSL